MQTIINLEPNDIDERLLNVIRELLARNVEITLKKQHVELTKFDESLPSDEVMREFQKAGYSDEFISDLKLGFESSKIYAK